MNRYTANHPHPDEIVDLRAYPAPEVGPRYRTDILLVVLGVLIVLAFGAWLVAPVISAAIDASTMEPLACRNLTADECVARAQEGW